MIELQLAAILHTTNIFLYMYFDKKTSIIKKNINVFFSVVKNINVRSRIKIHKILVYIDGVYW